ncbi:Putative Cofilin [Rhizopus microsporus]|nr:Putative Cofilin [Rhizopus microsporus]CEJ00906.1 Putative Cofilin [Rhizopus microsporus]
MSSGVSADNECIAKFNELKLRKSFKYIIYKLSDDNKQIVIEKAVESGSYDNFLNDLPENEPRYAVYDFDYVKPEEGQRNKITFFSWSPDTSRIRDKMLYASSKDSLRRQLQGVAVEIQGTDASEVAYETVLEKAQRSS